MRLGLVGQTELPHMERGEEKLELRKQREKMGDSRSCRLLDRLLCPNPTKHFLSVKIRERRKEKINKVPSTGEVAECLDTFIFLKVLQMAPFTVRVESNHAV